jgi:hypothetical protein
MTVNEHIDENSFAYDAQFPPDVAEGLPLTAARPPCEAQPPAIRRALRACARAMSRKQSD